MSQPGSASVLKLSLHGRLVGHVVGYQGGHNTLVFADEFRLDPERPTLTLTSSPRFPRAEDFLNHTYNHSIRLPEFLSNLLPEGAMREFLAQAVDTHPDNEFLLLSQLGADLPGAIVTEPVVPKDVPASLLRAGLKSASIAIPEVRTTGKKFSLAGIHFKFSMKSNDGRFLVGNEGEFGDWIVKTPSILHRQLPGNEFTAMSLASMVGVNVPELKLVDVDHLEGLPDINMPGEKEAFAIKRFDRSETTRVHAEDFAQVLGKYSHEKYTGGHYGQLAKILYEYSSDGIADLAEFTRRLAVNILLANGDAHLKNWGLVYEDTVTPRLSPAYDIVVTKAYTEDETTLALKLGGTKDWHQITIEHFRQMARKADIPWRVMRTPLKETIEAARTLWPGALNEMPMMDAHKVKLREHWQHLPADFRIES